MRILIGISICFGWAADAQERPKPEADFVNVVRSLPAEYQADLLLKVAESKQLASDKEWRRELIDEAFRIGQRAPESYPVAGGSHTDSRSYVTSSLYGLDSLTLRLRAAERMIPIDPGRAAEMFRETPIPAMPALTCQSAQAPVFEDYYRVLREIHQKGFTQKERERGEPASLLKGAMASLQFPGQVEPFGKMLMLLDVSPMERQELFEAFGAALANVSPADRGFMRHEQSLLDFAFQARMKGVVLTTVLRGLGSYITAHLAGERCSASIAQLTKTEHGRFSQLAIRFMAFSLDVSKQSPNAASMAVAKVQPGRDAGKWDDGDFWQSARSKEVLNDLKWLNHGNRKLPDNQRFWTAEERQSSEWGTRYQELQKRIEGWKGEEEPNALDHFWMQSFALHAAAQLVPPGPGKEQAMRRWLTHFEQGYQPGAAQNAWFGLLRRALPSFKPMGGASNGVEALLASRNPVVAAYAQWEVLAAR